MDKALKYHQMRRAATTGAVLCAAGLLPLLFACGDGRREAPAAVEEQGHGQDTSSGQAESLAHQLAAGELAFREQRFDESASSFTEATITDPGSIAAWYFLGNAHLALSRYPDAIGDYDQALNLDPNCVNALMGRAMTRWLSGDLELAERDYRTLIEVEPDRYLFYHQLEKVLTEDEKFAEIASLWEETRSAHPEWQVGSRIAQALYQGKEWALLYGHCLEVDINQSLNNSSSSDAQRTLYRFYSGVAQNHLGHPDSALKDLEGVWQERPAWPVEAYLSLFEELVYAASSVGDTAKAEQFRQLFEANYKDRP
jgi:tetratricopeptide (TPR) repeat protein